METLFAYWSSRELIANGLILLHLIGALAVGIAIGYERTYHGRAAGIRTYTLVCIASTALTVVNAYPQHWYGGLAQSPAFADPTRIIQGLMTGIGFLGAGVIMKEGFTIRGLATAASIWMTAAIGVLIGIGFYAAAIFAAFLTVSIMSGFRWLEILLPHQQWIHLSLVYPREQTPPEDQIRDLVSAHGFIIVDWSYELNNDGQQFEYHLVLQTLGAGITNNLARELVQSPHIVGFRLSPSRN
ncbi:MAG: MgtC/SapB family protein [Candidatus Contendobacter sp.]|nr:MgtC/SapB family protein [Candidatus Contendobacter sp.]